MDEMDEHMQRVIALAKIVDACTPSELAGMLQSIYLANADNGPMEKRADSLRASGLYLRVHVRLKGKGL